MHKVLMGVGIAAFVVGAWLYARGHQREKAGKKVTGKSLVGLGFICLAGGAILAYIGYSS